MPDTFNTVNATTGGPSTVINPISSNDRWELPHLRVQHLYLQDSTGGWHTVTVTSTGLIRASSGLTTLLF